MTNRRHRRTVATSRGDGRMTRAKSVARRNLVARNELFRETDVRISHFLEEESRLQSVGRNIAFRHSKATYRLKTRLSSPIQTINVTSPSNIEHGTTRRQQDQSHNGTERYNGLVCSIILARHLSLPDSRWTNSIKPGCFRTCVPTRHADIFRWRDPRKSHESRRERSDGRTGGKDQLVIRLCPPYCSSPTRTLIVEVGGFFESSGQGVSYSTQYWDVLKKLDENSFVEWMETGRIGDCRAHETG